MVLCQASDLYQIQLTFLAPSLLTRGYTGAELLIQMVAMLANVFWLVAVGKRLKRSLGILQQQQSGQVKPFVWVPRSSRHTNQFARSPCGHCCSSEGFHVAWELLQENKQTSQHTYSLSLLLQRC